MASIETTPQPVLGEQGEPCRECGAPLAADQRYCLNCGTARTGPRVDFSHYLNAGNGNGATPPGGAPAAAQPSGGRDWTPVLALGALFALGVMLAVGVLIGENGNNGGGSATTPAPIVQVGGGSAGGSKTASTGQPVDTANTSFQSDWPSGKEGYTVELGTLPKSGTTPQQVDTAKADAKSKGAPDVGALDSDDYGSLPAGNYIIYSGVYTTKADATKALGSLKSKFPDAKVVQVSTKSSSGGGGGGPTANSAQDLTGAKNSSGPVTASDQALQQLDNASGSDYQKQSQQLPDEIQTQGKPPPKDHKAPGAGGGGVTIK
jgi:hypothetical protein